MYLVLAWRNIWRNPRRSLITMASVFFAVLLAIFMRSATKGVYENMTDTMVRFSSGYIQVHAKGYWDERVLDNSFVQSDGLVDSLLDLGMASVVPRLETFALLSYGDKSRPIAIIGIDPIHESEATGLGRKVIEGVLPTSNEHGIIIGSKLAQAMRISVGDTVVMIGQGYHGSMAAALLPVKTVIRFGSPRLDENLAYMPIRSCQSVFSADSLLTSYSVMISDPASVVEQSAKISSLLDTGRYEVMHWKEMLPELDQLIEADSAGHYLTIYLLYLVISFGLFGTMLMMTRERLHEFGILVAIGMKKHVLGMIVVAELFFISIAGIISASLVGYPLVTWLKYHPIHVGGRVGELYEGFGLEAIIPCSNDPGVIAYQALLVMAVTMVLSLYPFFKIQRLSPLQAINS
jgi:ABC-type lipoprotein release transport system permease subunit